MGDNLKNLVGRIYRKFNFQDEFHKVIVFGITEEFVLVKWRKEAAKPFELNFNDLLTKGSATCSEQATVTYYTEAGKLAWQPGSNTVVNFEPSAEVTDFISKAGIRKQETPEPAAGPAPRPVPEKIAYKNAAILLGAGSDAYIYYRHLRELVKKL